MKKILSWTFSGFFRSFGRALFFLLLLIFVSLIISYNGIKIPNLWAILDVSANTINPSYYDNGLDFISGAKFYNWSSSTSYSELSSASVYDDSSDDYSYSVMSANSVSNFGSNGISFTALLSNISLISNSYYSTILYICMDNNVNVNMSKVYVGSTYANSFSHQSNYSKELLSNSIDHSAFGTTNVPNYCKAISFIYQPSYDGNVLNIRLTSSNSLGTWYIVGTKTEYIGVANGLTSSQVSNIIDSSISNSNLATASDIQSIENAVDDLSTDIENMSDAIVDNQNQNTQDIIDNQNANSQAQIDSQKVCEFIDKNKIETDNKTLYGDGTEATWNATGITSYIPIDNNSEITFLTKFDNNSYNCFYNVNKEKISCFSNANVEINTKINIPTNARYIRFTINKYSNVPTVNICKNGNQAMQDTMTNDDSSGASSEATSFFDNFTTNNHGLTGIITAPLNAINSLTSQSCSPLVLPIPFVNTNITLPCMRNIYTQNFPTFMQIYDVITLGIMSYWVMVRIFSLVKDFKNPQHDEVEVLDL